MRLTRDRSHGARAVSVQCLTCAGMVRLADAVYDLDGPSFKAYYHDDSICRPDKGWVMVPVKPQCVEIRQVTDANGDLLLLVSEGEQPK